MAAICFTGVTKTYRAFLRRQAVVALDGLSFEVPRGSIVALLGGNGAGKTTAIHAIMGFLRIDAGSVTVLARSNDDPAAHRGVGFQGEALRPYPMHTARDGLEYFGRLAGLSSAESKRRAEDGLERWGLARDAARKLDTYSKGMAQRFWLCQAFLDEPELVVLDEPASALDPDGREQLLETLEAHRARGGAALFATHSLSDVERVCDAVVVLERGRCIASLGREELRAQAGKLAALYRRSEAHEAPL